jgi:hypothetical protein
MSRFGPLAIAFALFTGLPCPVHAEEPLPPPPPPPPSVVPTAGAAVPAPPAVRTPAEHPPTAPPPPRPNHPVLPPNWAMLEAGLVPLVLTTSTPGAGFELYRKEDDPEHETPIATCKRSCRLWVYPGTYRIQVTKTASTVSGNRVIEVPGPMAIDFRPDTSAKRSVGLLMGIAGPVMVLAGLSIGLSSYDHEEDGGASVDSNVAVAMVLGGLVATPVGWVLFGTAYKPEYATVPILDASPPPDAKPPQWSIAPSVTGSGLGLVGTGTF